MLTKRRKLLQYLRRTNFDRYSTLIVKLGLRDNYAKQVRDLTLRMQACTVTDVGPGRGGRGRILSYC